ncbi:MAG TPA: DUF3606 domain-containing protein [Hymenobacter sp.]|uniref:DUF3606 domain-containing protein n=1 Tax=Hymenobacter sp. TaxID=1898978 RepID=UPI002ED85AFD
MASSLYPGYTPPSLQHVDIIEVAGRQYWCKTFQCTEQQLRAAVAAVGHDVNKVREHVHGKGYRP